MAGTLVTLGIGTGAAGRIVGAAGQAASAARFGGQVTGPLLVLVPVGAAVVSSVVPSVGRKYRGLLARFGLRP